ncbi:unnamed protein product [Triticum turgidum subsp. durum]|uniref:Uncharacterized protein n=1 Tax=Triticum turgidum subsp. durum TaxID=4567 RepID=A0A9R0TXB8_TRITD|nr:unnamed protein product [Triticum turgidum subsp. durum]
MATAAAAAARFTPAILPRPRRRVPAPCASASSASGRGNRRLRCEFVASVGNGALSGEDDPRLIDRQKALDAAMTDINNSFGKGSVTRLGSAGGAFVETFPSGCLTLDFALGGGLPKGRVVEVYGPESSGKTTLALHAIAEIQKLGGNAMLVDAEHAFDPAYSKALGVDIENLIVCQPDNGEMALEIADRMCRSGAIDLICIDSVSALTPRAEIEAKGDEDIGVKVRVRVQKSKVSRPYKQAEFEIMFGEGVSKLGCILDCAELMEVVAKKGSWYSYKDIRLGQGREKALQYLRENPTVCDEIEKVVRAMIPEGTRHMAMLAFGQSSSQPEEEEVYDD